MTKKTLPLLSSILKNIATQLTDALYDHQIQSVIIEGGRQTLQTFIDANLWDEARVFRGTIHLKEGTAAPILSGFSLNKIQSVKMNL
jgi:diaminohydroxyphosphoribosylaminopyrimidine deaminase/5-amino-6-(5-phosphoribosylamino)uracil reductase